MTAEEWLDEMWAKSSKAFNDSYNSSTRTKHMHIMSCIDQCRSGLKCLNELNEYRALDHACRVKYGSGIAKYLRLYD